MRDDETIGAFWAGEHEDNETGHPDGPQVVVRMGHKPAALSADDAERLAVELRTAAADARITHAAAVARKRVADLAGAWGMFDTLVEMRGWSVEKLHGYAAHMHRHTHDSMITDEGHDVSRQRMALALIVAGERAQDVIAGRVSS